MYACAIKLRITREIFPNKASFSYAFLAVWDPAERRVPSSFLFLTHIEQFVLEPEMATGGGDQVWTWKKRKTVAATRAPHTEEIK